MGAEGKKISIKIKKPGLEEPSKPAPAKTEVTELLPFRFEPQKKSYKIGFSTVTIGATSAEGGSRGFALTVGGDTAPPFQTWEARSPTRPIIAHNIFDIPIPLPKHLKKHFNIVLDSPAKWARKCVDEFGAKMISLNIQSERTPEEIAATVGEVLRSVEVPLMVSAGSGNLKRDVAVVEKIAQTFPGEKIVVALINLPMPDQFDYLPSEIHAYYKVLASHGQISTSGAQMVTSQLAWLNKVGKGEGVSNDRLLADISFPPLAYNLEIGVTTVDSVYQRVFDGGDADLNQPMIVAPVNAWMTKESYKRDEKLGPVEERGTMWELVTAIAALISGAHVLVMMDPYAIKICEAFIDRLYSPPAPPPDPSEIYSWITGALG